MTKIIAEVITSKTAGIYEMFDDASDTVDADEMLAEYMEAVAAAAKRDALFQRAQHQIRELEEALEQARGKCRHAQAEIEAIQKTAVFSDDPKTIFDDEEWGRIMSEILPYRKILKHYQAVCSIITQQLKPLRKIVDHRCNSKNAKDDPLAWLVL